MEGLAGADLDGDGHQDLVIAGAGADGGLRVLQGNGTATFGAQRGLGGPGAIDVLLRDVNGDQRPDVVAVHGTSWSLALGQPGGTFGALTVRSAGIDVESIAAGNVNGDALVDLIFGDIGNTNVAGNVDVAVGQGNSAFAAFQGFPGSPWSLTGADFNGDGVIDVVSADRLPSGSGVLNVMLGVDGGYGVGTALVSGGMPIVSATGDFNGDGFTDVLVGLYSSGQLKVFLGHGNGTFTAGSTYTAPASTRSIALGDINGDGHLDVAVCGASSTDVRLGTATGTFGAATSYPSGTCWYTHGVLLLDVNGDGFADLLTPSPTASSLDVRLATCQ